MTKMNKEAKRFMSGLSKEGKKQFREDYNNGVFD